VDFGRFLQIIPGFSIFGELAPVLSFTFFTSFITSFPHLFFGRPLVLTPPISNLFNQFLTSSSEPGSSVGIVTGYGLDGPGIESRWGARFSAPVQTGPGAHPASNIMDTGSFPGVESGRGVTLTPHPLLVRGLKTE
jgi:hypothetical protein